MYSILPRVLIHATICGAVVFGSFTVLPAEEGTPAGRKQGPASEIQYLVFQVFVYAPNPEGKTQPFNTAAVKKTVAEIRSSLDGIRGDGIRRQLGFAVGPLTLDHTDAALQEIIRASFEIALELDVAVVFHLDDSMFWINRPSLWRNPDNVEWSDWNRTVHPQRFVGWAPTKLAPQMCYNSPSLRNELSRIARTVIGSAIRKGLEYLEARRKPHLFAGVIAGWETHVADFRFAAPDERMAKRIGADQFPRTRIGYCALSNLGFGAADPPKDFDHELEKVVEDFAKFWAKELNVAGVQKERIYTHIAVVTEQQIPLDVIRRKFGIENPSFSALTGHSPPWTAFNSFSRPGFSTYPSGFKKRGTDAVFDAIYAELAKQGRPAWASSEGTNMIVEGKPAGPGLSWEEYLGSMFNHGASLVTIFGWQDVGTPFGKATRSPDAIVAYKKFLSGLPLQDRGYQKREDDTRSLTGSQLERIRSKREQVQDMISKHAPSPEDLKRIESLMREWLNLMESGNPTEAEAKLDRVLTILAPEPRRER